MNAPFHGGSNGTIDKDFAGVVDTGEQLIAGIVDTVDKHSFANISANFRKKIETVPMEILMGQGDTDS